jgi:hypothetical protein
MKQNNELVVSQIVERCERGPNLGAQLVHNNLQNEVILRN